MIFIFVDDKNNGDDSDGGSSRSSYNGDEEVILLMKDPDIIRHSISATNYTLASLGFHADAYQTYSSPSGNGDNTNIDSSERDKKMQGKGKSIEV